MQKNRVLNMTILCLSISLGLAACQGHKTRKETLSYQFSNESCTTGKKAFSDLASYCAALKDEAANNNCESEKRLETYNNKCTDAATKTTPAAGKSVEAEAASDTSQTYDFTANGCTTGKKTFPDLATYCAGLKDDEANNHCAAQMRIETYRKNCMFDLKSLSQGEKAEATQETEEKAQTEVKAETESKINVEAPAKETAAAETAATETSAR